MANEFALPDDRIGFVFHASELVNGGRTITREKYPREKREFFLRSLCEIPEHFALPIVCHSVPRKKIQDRKPFIGEDEVVLEALLHASIACAHGVEQVMTKFGQDGEVALLVYEQNGSKSSAIREYHNLFRSERFNKYLETKGLRNLVEFQRVIDTAHFAAKTDSSILQVADACAYVLARHLRGKPQPSEWITPLLRNIAFGPKALEVSIHATRRPDAA
jgi:hypothetical protein